MPIFPAAGASVKVTPQAGFGNGDVPFRWSITYPDCPGPDSIHSSWVEYREVGSGEFKATQRGGPYLGEGNFTTPGNVFPQQEPIQYEWRVAWACGANNPGFPGSKGVSEVLPFTLLPLGGANPAAGGSATLRVTKFTRAPAKPRAGRRLVATLGVAGSPRPTTGTVICTARAGNQKLKPLVRRYKNGVGSCAWLIPKNATGGRLTGTVTFRALGQKLTRSFQARIS